MKKAKLVRRDSTARLRRSLNRSRVPISLAGGQNPLRRRTARGKKERIVQGNPTPCRVCSVVPAPPAREKALSA
jgi:hypothetical protein